MSAEDTIKIVVDDVELDRAIAKARTLIQVSSQSLGTRDIKKGVTGISGDFSDVLRLAEETESQVPDILRKFGETDLPGINRELRLILGQVPGMRNLIQQYFRLKRIQRSVGAATEEAQMLRDVLTNPQFVLTMVATLIVVTKTIITHFERLKQERVEYEEFLRRERGLSRREFESLRGLGSGAAARKEYYWSTPG